MENQTRITRSSRLNYDTNDKPKNVYELELHYRWELLQRLHAAHQEKWDKALISRIGRKIKDSTDRINEIDRNLHSEGISAYSRYSFVKHWLEVYRHHVAYERWQTFFVID